MRELIAKFYRNEKGATAIEYGLIAALMSVVVITGMTALKAPTEGVFSAIAGKMTDNTPK